MIFDILLSQNTLFKYQILYELNLMLEIHFEHRHLDLSQEDVTTATTALTEYTKPAYNLKMRKISRVQPPWQIRRQ